MKFSWQVSGRFTSCLSLDELLCRLSADTPPIEYVFQAPPLPTLPQSGHGFHAAGSSFQKYKTTLRLQIMGRTSLLNDVLNTLEDCAHALQNDLARISAEECHSTQYARSLIQVLILKSGGVLGNWLSNSEQAVKQKPRHSVHMLSVFLRPQPRDILMTQVGQFSWWSLLTEALSTEGNMRSLVFSGRICNELASSSPFASGIGCEEKVVYGLLLASYYCQLPTYYPLTSIDFRNTMGALRDKLVDRWRQHIVTKAVREYWRGAQPSKAIPYGDYHFILNF
jgi:conserved oligomeric Golgi complex subunit 1